MKTALEKIVERYHLAATSAERARWFNLVMKVMQFRIDRARRVAR
jgi:hypothetical protein